MEYLYEDYAATLGTVRQEYRLAPVLDLVTLAITYGYDTTLAEIYNNRIADPNEECLRVETIVFRCGVALAQRLGLGINPTVAYHKPKELVRLIQGLTSTFEEFEDKDTLFGLLCSDEPPEVILEELCRYVYGDNEIHFEDLIVTVEPRVLNVMRNFLAAESAEENESESPVARTRRIAEYLRVFPQNPSAFVFLNLSTPPDIAAVIDALDFTNEDNFGEAELIAMYAVGVVVINHDTYDEAYNELETVVDQLNSDSIPDDEILKKAVAGLKAIYLGETNESD